MATVSRIVLPVWLEAKVLKSKDVVASKIPVEKAWMIRLHTSESAVTVSPIHPDQPSRLFHGGHTIAIGVSGTSILFSLIAPELSVLCGSWHV